MILHTQPRKCPFGFVVELRLRTRPAEERAWGIILRAEQNIYHAVGGQALPRLDLIRASAAWKSARAMTKGLARTQASGRVPSFGFTASAVEQFAPERSSMGGFRPPRVLPHKQKLQPGAEGVRSRNGVVKHRGASGVASARNGERRCGRSPSLIFG
jgi:hypothetical protein